MKSKVVGAGLIAGATWVAYNRIREPKPLLSTYAEAPTQILIVGGGFGGLAAARELARMLGGSEEVGVALLDRVNYTTFWPMVPSVIPRNLEVRHVARSIRRILRPLGIEFFQGEVKGVDFEARQVKTDDGAFSYDYLILSPGSRTTYFGTPGAKENTMDTKGLRHALQIRNQVIDCFEEAERLRGELPDGLLNFVFLGGGPTGVEAAAATHDLIFPSPSRKVPCQAACALRMGIFSCSLLIGCTTRYIACPLSPQTAFTDEVRNV